MKKVLFSALVLGLMFTTSCKSDDDNNDAAPACQTCEIIGISSEYCDNGDGTMTVTTAGQDQSVDLNGSSFADFIAALEAGGATCN